MNEVTELIHKLRALSLISSRNEKEKFLLQNKDDETFKSVLKFLFDNKVTTGISSKKINKDTRICYYEEESRDYWIEDLLEYFETHSTGSDSDISYVNFYISHLTEDEEEQEFLKSIITKTLRLGIDTKTCQKIYGKEFIKTLDVMLGTSIENCTIPVSSEISISRKLNGVRCFYYKGALYSRQGKVYTGCEHIIKDLKELSELCYSDTNDYVYDGELILKDSCLTDSERFQKGTGIANSNSKQKTELKLVIFDTLPTKEFEEGLSSETYFDRKKRLNVYRNFIKQLNCKNLDIVEFVYEGNDHSEIWKSLEYAETHDWEGVMVNLNTPYECKRSRNLIKVKKFYTYDLRVIGLEEGTGRNKNKLGALLVDFGDNDVSVGSGFTDEQRVEYWNNPNTILGEVVEVRYKEVTTNQEGKKSLQFPVFIRVREHGKEPSIN